MKQTDQRGHILVLSGPSGVGKSTVIASVRRERPTVAFSVSHTSRAPRAGEENGVHYHFVTKEGFEDMIRRGQFLEYTCYQGNYYGTSVAAVESLLEEGKDVLLDIEVEGAANVRKNCPDAIEVFLLPPSFEELSRRLHARNSESEEVIQGRLERAREECKCIPSYDYVVVNDKVERAAGEILSILNAADCRVKRRIQLAADIMHLDEV